MKIPTLARPLGVAALIALSGCGLVHPPRTGTTGGTIDDQRVAGIALVANNVEISYALLAPSRTADSDVRTYAARMRADHTSLNASLTDLLARLDLPAQDDAAGVALRDSSAVHRAHVASLHGHAFDVAYADTDLQAHRTLLDMIDHVLVPSADRAELRDYLHALRPAVAAHLAHAEQLRATVAARRQ